MLDASDDEFELVEHPHEEVTHVDHPRYTSPEASGVEDNEHPDPSTDTLGNLELKELKDASLSQLRAISEHKHGSMRSCVGVLIIFAVLRLLGTPKRTCIFPAPQSTPIWVSW